MTPLQDAARTAASHMEPYTRPGSDAILYRVTDSAPDWMHDLVMAAHDDSRILPDDYRYRFIADALDLLADTPDADDIDPEPDAYTTELLDWARSTPGRWAGYCDDALSEWGHDLPTFWHLLAIAQQMERHEVLDQVRAFLQEQLDDEDADA